MSTNPGTTIKGPGRRNFNMDVLNLKEANTSSASDEDTHSDELTSTVQARKDKVKTTKTKNSKHSRKHSSDSSASDSESGSSGEEDAGASRSTKRVLAQLTEQVRLLSAQVAAQNQDQFNWRAMEGGLRPNPRRQNNLGNGQNDLINNFDFDQFLDDPAPVRSTLPPPGQRGGRRLNIIPPGRNLGGGGDLPLNGGNHPNAQMTKPASRLDFKRVDQVWDSNLHNYRLQDTVEGNMRENKYDGYLFHVRRTFDWDGRYKQTDVVIKSEYLRECLQEVMGDIKGVSLVEASPKLDPNMLFLYLDDLRTYSKALKAAKPTAADKHARKKEQRRIDKKRQHLKVMLKYIDTDYDVVKKSLWPMLENGLITFEYLWALWKPNTLVFTNLYGSTDQPRVLKVESAEKQATMMRGQFYFVDGKYFEYDGKTFGYGSMAEEVPKFNGARKITSLPCYPLKYHKREEQLRKELIERGKKFVALGGVHYKSHEGMAFFKRKRQVVKVNINGRIMVDPSVHRRINPNYMAGQVRPKDQDGYPDDDDASDDDDDQGDDLSAPRDVVLDPRGGVRGDYLAKLIIRGRAQPPPPTFKAREVDADVSDAKPDSEGKLPGSDNGEVATPSEDTPQDSAPKSDKTQSKLPQLTDEDYLIASPVVLGFAFAEKLWLELTISGVKEINWNEGAYESLVLPPKTKDIVKALVESHKYHAAESIDDVIQGKGKGLVAVLHGPPGTGKTLTAEGISEQLKCPLYMVSAGELGTDSRFLEAELQKILDICHAWGAVLLLDEADVFLEKRNMHEIQRNALVSIFLRQLEYFQGILFLTTNRVETFDDAFQSRIHIALRYEALEPRARKAIFKIFIERVQALETGEPKVFNEDDYTLLAKYKLNGRQIKNAVRTAQALAVNKGEPLSMDHIRHVLGVQMDFDKDLKGGPGYEEAMRSYF